MDETFVRENYKGNHRKSKFGFVMSRKSRKRGGEDVTRGISKDQICVATAIDHNGNVVNQANFLLFQNQGLYSIR